MFAFQDGVRRLEMNMFSNSHHQYGASRWVALSLLCLALLFCVTTPSVGQEASGDGAEGDAEDQEASTQPVVAEAAGEEIVVWGDRLEESIPLELEQYGSRVEVVESEQIRDSGYIDVSQIPQSAVPGLYVAQKNGPFDYVNASLQGSRTKEILWLVDGVRISNRLYDSTTPLDTLPAHVVERVEVLKGGQGLFYGTQSVGGVINVVTRSHTAKSDGSISIGSHTNEGTQVNGSARGGKGAHRFVAYASEDDADGFQPFRDSDYQPSSTDRERGYDVRTFGGRYRGGLGSQLLISAQLQQTDAQLDFAAAEDRAVSFNERDEVISSLKLDWSPNPRFDLYAKGYWHDWDSTFTRVDNDLAVPGGLTTIYDHAIWQFEDTGLNVVGEVDLSDEATLLFGYDYQRYEGRDDVFLIGEQAESVNALFTQARFDFDVLDGLGFAVGARHNEPSDGQNKTIWNLAGEVALNDKYYTRAQVGTSFRLPSAYELYVIDPCCEKGNPNLVGEESFNAEAGVGGRHSRFHWEVNSFYRNVEDLISIDFDLPDFPDGLIVNTDAEVGVLGYEVIAGFSFTDSLSMSFSSMRNEAEAKGSSDQIPDVPLDTSKLSLTWRPGSLPLAFLAGVNHVGDVFDTVGGGVGRVEHGNYTVLDLAASYTLAERHRIGVRLENVFDEEYDTRVVRVRRDIDGSSYGAGTLGLPRTLYVSYGFLF